MKGGGRGGEVKKKRGGEKLGRKDTQARKQRGRKEEEDASLVQKKDKTKGLVPEKCRSEGENFREEGEHFDSISFL